MSDDRTVLPFPESAGGPDPLQPLLEALLLASGDPVREKDLVEAIGDVRRARVREALEAWALALRGRNAGMQLVQVAGGWQLRTHPRFAPEVLRLTGARPIKLSSAALEVLSIVAYQQPVTRMDVEEIRGVASGAVLRHLGERGLVRVSGRREVPGRPLEYGTTRAFLELFGLKDLRGLPTLAERASMEGDP